MAENRSQPGPSAGVIQGECLAHSGPARLLPEGERKVMKRWLADVVSFSRVVLLVPFLWWESRGSIWALPVLAAIVVSDLLDGWIARRLGTAGSVGALIDAACDVVVLMAAAVVLGLSDPRYIAAAGLMAITFGSYTVFSLVIGRFAYTRLGRYDGILCYVLAGVACGHPLLPSAGAAAAVEWTVLGVTAAVLAASTGENLAGAVRWMNRKATSLP